MCSFSQIHCQTLTMYFGKTFDSKETFDFEEKLVSSVSIFKRIISWITFHIIYCLIRLPCSNKTTVQTTV